MKLVVNKDNIDEVFANPEKYKGYSIEIDGNNIRDGRKKFTMQVERLLFGYKRLPYTISIQSPEKSSPLIRCVLGCINDFRD